MFVMDSSGSVGETGWEIEVEFVKDMITSGVDQDSYVAVINFASGAWVQWNFTSSQVRSDIIDHVNSISYTRGSTWMTTALETAITVYEQTGDPNIDNLLLLITDGNPRPTQTQLVCDDSDMKDALDAAGLYCVYISHSLFFFYVVHWVGLLSVSVLWCFLCVCF